MAKLARVSGFLPFKQVNPAGYAGTGRGVTPLTPVQPAQGPANNFAPVGGSTPIPSSPANIAPVTGSTPLPLNPGGVYKPNPSSPLQLYVTDLGVGVRRIENLGVLGVRI